MKDKTIAGIDMAAKLLVKTCVTTYALYNKMWYDILLEIGNTIADEVSNGNDVEFPYNLGTLTATTKNINIADSRKMVTDYVATKKLWEEHPELTNVKFIYVIHDDLTYNSFRWIRNKKSSFVKYMIYYKISMTRSAKKLMAQKGENGKRYDFNKSKVIK